jgi:hypothetical protein
MSTIQASFGTDNLSNKSIWALLGHGRLHSLRGKAILEEENGVKACLMRKQKPASGMLDTHVFIVKEPIEPIYSKQVLFL